ncbi:MAG: dTDP-4-dehydrorhamnose 3,5-epimerase family protein [Candidatus Acidiferrales bacterium]
MIGLRGGVLRDPIGMIFHETKLSGVFEIGIEAKHDERGFFARTWCQNEFKAHGLNPLLAQCSVSFNRRKGTLRGMHYQAAPCAEAKLVRCTRGALHDVVIDLRAESRTFKEWIAVTLTAEKHNMVYLPEGCAHGFLTLADDTEVFYQISEFYDAQSARGVRWDDRTFRIDWPNRPEVISERDRAYPNFE